MMKKMVLVSLILVSLFSFNPIARSEGDFPSKQFTPIWNYPEQFKMMIDYGAETDGQPLYIGYAPKGEDISVDNWTIYYCQYDDDRQLISRTVGFGAWEDRATTVTYE